MKNYKEIVAKKIVELMKNNYSSVNELSIKMGVPTSTMYDWINARSEPSIGYLCLIADFFGVTVDYLIGRED